jgi:uncharacterized membrane protein YjdF
MNARKALMLALRGMYAAGILLFALQQNWGAVLFNVLIFVGSLVILYAARYDEDYYVVDALAMLTFTIALLPSYFDVWPEPTSIKAMLLGFDKIFHAAGGACLAMFAAILLRDKIPDRRILYGGIIIFALALGGAWEVLEWLLSVLPEPFTTGSSGYADSMLDMVADTLGATILLLALRLRRYI